MRNLLMMMVMLLSFVISVPCFAISTDDLSIGNVRLFQPLSDVISVYGSPVTSRNMPANGGWTEYTFVHDGNKIEIGIPAGGDSVISISVSGNSNFATKAGIKIGSSITDIKNAYGVPFNEGEVKFKGADPYYNVAYKMQSDSTICMNFRLIDNKVTYFSFYKLRK